MLSNLLPDWCTPQMREIRGGFGEGLLDLGHDERVIVLTGNLGKSLRVAEFAQRYPQRFFDVGVAEQHMIGMAAGLALEGLIPVTTSFAVFSPGRSWDQVRVAVAYGNTNVKIAGSH